MNMLRLQELIKKTGLSRSSIYRYVAKGNFPQPVQLGERTIAWVESEVDDWLMAKIKEREQ